MKINKVSDSEVFNIFIKNSLIKNASTKVDAIEGALKHGDELLDPVRRLLTSAASTSDDAFTVTLRKLKDSDPEILSGLTRLARESETVFKPSLKNIQKAVTDPAYLTEINKIAQRNGFEDSAKALRPYVTYLSNLQKLQTGQMTEAQFEAYIKIEKSNVKRSMDFLSGIKSSGISPGAAASSAVKQPAQSAGQAAGGAAGDAATKAEKEALQEAEEAASKKSKPGADDPNPDITRARAQADLDAQLLKNRQMALENAPKSIKDKILTGVLSAAGLSTLIGGGLLLWGYFGVTGFFSDLFKTNRENISEKLLEAIACLSDIPAKSGTNAEKIKNDLLKDLNRLNTITKLSKSSVAEDIQKEYAQIIQKLLADQQSPGSLGYAVKYFTDHPEEINISSGITSNVIGFSQDDLTESINCISENGSAAMDEISRLVGQIMRSQGGQGMTDLSGTSDASQRSISGVVKLSNGTSYNVTITTRKPSIPQRFALYFARGAGPDNFFSTPAFAAFVDPDENSPLGGVGLVPNAVGKQPIEQRLASAIKYCYNNDIDSDRQLRRLLIQQINAGTRFIRRLFTNEPEQRVLQRAITYYSRAASSASNEDIDESQAPRRRGLFGGGLFRRKNKGNVEFTSSASIEENNFNKSTNKQELTMNKLALSKDKVKYHEDAVKGLSDKLMKSYYTGLDGMYSEKPKAPKPEKYKSYGFQEETGFDLVQKSHPKSIYLAEAMGDGGLVESGFEAKVKSEGIALNRPSGNFQSKYAETHAYLEKLLKVAEKQNKTEAYDLINQTIKQFFN